MREKRLGTISIFIPLRWGWRDTTSTGARWSNSRDTGTIISARPTIPDLWAEQRAHFSKLYLHAKLGVVLNASFSRVRAIARHWQLSRCLRGTSIGRACRFGIFRRLPCVYPNENLSSIFPPIVGKVRKNIKWHSTGWRRTKISRAISFLWRLKRSQRVGQFK